MINIANPIYDNVFKYLVEDERITKTLLSDRIYERLLSAAADSDMRMRMNVEEEVLAAMEDNDTMKMQIKTLKEKAQKQDEQIQKQDEQIQKQDEQIQKQDEQIQKQDEQIQKQDEQIQKQDEQLRNAIRMFAASGVPSDILIKNFNVSEEFVLNCLK